MLVGGWDVNVNSVTFEAKPSIPKPLDTVENAVWAKIVSALLVVDDA